MHNQRTFILIAATLGMLATFLPWATIPLYGAINGTEGDGWISLAIFLIPVIACITGQKTQAIKMPRLLAVVIPGLAAAALGVWKIIDLNALNKPDGDNPYADSFDGSIGIGFGVYVLIAAGLAVAILGFIVKNKKIVSIHSSTSV